MIGKTKENPIKTEDNTGPQQGIKTDERNRVPLSDRLQGIKEHHLITSAKCNRKDAKLNTFESKEHHLAIREEDTKDANRQTDGDSTTDDTIITNKST